MNWLQKHCQSQLIPTFEKGYYIGKGLADPSSTGRTMVNLTKDVANRMRRKNPQSNPVTGPGQHNCAVCGQYLPSGGIVDIQNKAKRGVNALLCLNHANQFGVLQSMSLNTPGPKKTNTINTPNSSSI